MESSSRYARSLLLAVRAAYRFNDVRVKGLGGGNDVGLPAFARPSLLRAKPLLSPGGPGGTRGIVTKVKNHSRLRNDAP